MYLVHLFDDGQLLMYVFLRFFFTLSNVFVKETNASVSDISRP
jgi:hypothetical protein